MPISQWWTVIDAVQTITGGPYLWDGSTAWSPPSGQRAVNSDPTASGYTWPSDPNAGVTLASLAARVSVLESRLTTEARGVKSWPAIGALALGATNTQRVTLKTAMPNTNYTPQALLVGGSLVGSLTIQSAVVVDRQNVDVTIKAGVLVTITLGAVAALVFADSN